MLQNYQQNNYIQNINYIKYRSFAEKMHFGGHIGGHFMILYGVSPSLFKIFYSNTSSNRINILNLYTQYLLHKYWSFQNKSHFGGHLGGHLEFLETLNDASLASFRIFKTNMSSNIINNKKNYILQCRVKFGMDRTIWSFNFWKKCL